MDNDYSNRWDGIVRRRSVLQGLALVSLPALSGCQQVQSRIGEFGVGHPPLEEVKTDAVSPTYEKLYRNISDYENEYVHYSGVITDIVPDSNASEYLIRLPGHSYEESEILYCHWGGDPFKVDDEVEFWGQVLGLTSYNSLVGEQNVPEIDLVEMRRR